MVVTSDACSCALYGQMHDIVRDFTLASQADSGLEQLQRYIDVNDEQKRKAANAFG